MELIIRPDLSWNEKIKDFLKECLHPNTIICDKKLFEWFYQVNQSNPTLKNNELRFLIAHENNKLYSLLGFYECDFLVKGKIKRGAWGCCWFTAKTNHNMFLGGLLRKAFLNEFKVAGGIGCSDTTISIARQMGSKIIDRINPLVLNKESFKIMINNSLNKINETNNYNFEIFSENASRIFYKRSNKFQGKNVNTIRTLLSEEYFTWRYGAHPYFNYMITKFKFDNDNYDSGAFIWRLVKLSNGKNLCRIVNFDISNHQYYEFITVNLIRELIFEMQKYSCDYIDCFTTDIEMINLFKKFGWNYDKENLYPNLIDPVDKSTILNAELFTEGINNYKNLDIKLFRSDGDADRPNRKSSISK